MVLILFLLAGVCSSESISVGSTQAIGTCACDLTQNSCDQYCCCDSLCSVNVISKWGSKCVSGTLLPLSDTCSSSSSMSLEAGWRGMKVATDLVNRALCVQVDNSPPSSNYSLISSGTQARSYNTTATSLAVELDEASSTGYTAGAYMYASVTGHTSYSYVWSLPTPDVYGLCSFAYPVKWMAGYPLTSCVHYFDPSSECGQFDIGYFSGTLNIATTSGQTSTVKASLGKVYKRSSNSNDAISSSQSALYSNGVCSNAVVEAHYSVYSNSQTSVTSVSVDIFLEDISTPSLSQAFSVSFITNTTGTISKSGNPGYQFGKKINTGYLVSDTSINYYDTGFQIPGINSDGSCGAATVAGSPYLVFGEDLLVSCYVSYTYAELQSICNSSNTALLQPSLFFADSVVSLLGKYGFINYTYVDDWVVMNNGTSFAVSGFDTSSGTCTISNLLSYYITYAGIGNLLNTQNKIIYAQRDFVGSTFWQFKLDDRTKTQKFFFTLSVSFVRYVQQLYDFFPPAPNPLPVMPDDIMYPFKITMGRGIGVVGLGLLVNFL